MFKALKINVYLIFDGFYQDLINLKCFEGFCKVQIQIQVHIQYFPAENTKGVKTKPKIEKSATSTTKMKTLKEIKKKDKIKRRSKTD